MQTMNISLTRDQIKAIDGLMLQYGFANRSEFFRSLIRLIIHKPEAISTSDALLFSPPATKNISKIIKDFTATKKYSPSFIKDLEKGLKESSYFTKK